MLVPSVRNVLAAYSVFGSEWVKFVEWTSKKFPKQRFHEENLGTFLAENTVNLFAGSKVVAQYRQKAPGSYSKSPAKYSCRVFGDGRTEVRVAQEALTPPSFEDMKNALEKVLKESPILLNQFNQKDLHVDYTTQLTTAWMNAEKVLKTLIVTPMERSAMGSLPSGDLWVRYDIHEDHQNLTPLMLFFDYKARTFYVRSFGEKVEVKTFSGFLGLLEKIPQIVKKGLATLPAHESAALSGKITSENVVSRIMEVKAGFDRIDEWQDTVLKITLMLSTAQPVSQRLIIKWVSDHWSEVLKMAPSKVPAPSKGRGRSDERDEPAYGLGWIVPNQVPRPDQHGEVNVSQDGKRAIVEVRASHR